MDGENTTPTGQEPGGSEPQAGTPEGQAPEGTQSNPPGSEYLSPEATQKVIADLRAEAAQQRIQLKKLKELEQFKAEYDASQLTEQQKAAAEVEALAQEKQGLTEALRTAKLETVIAVQAAEMRLVDPDTVLQLVDRSTIEFDDAGAPDAGTVKQALTNLLAAKPFLQATTPTPTPGSTNPGRDQGMSINEVQAMTPEQLAALPPEKFNAALKALGGSK